MLRYLFILLIVRPVVYFVLGLRLRGRQHLPHRGPAIIAANHNSHFDTAVLIAMFPQKTIRLIRPAAAADYFLTNPLLSWFAQTIFDIIPVNRLRAERTGDPLAGCHEALDAGSIIIFFPEGSRGVPEQRAQFRSGLARLAEGHPQAPVFPVFLHGMGKAWPRGTSLVVPFICDAFVGAPIRWQGDADRFMQHYESAMQELEAQGSFPLWSAEPHS